MTILPPYARAADALDAYAREVAAPGVVDGYRIEKRVADRADIRRAFVALAATLSENSAEYDAAVNMGQLFRPGVGDYADPGTIASAAQRWRDRGARR